ncbi:single-strand binding protein [Laribacter hongkongensis HLHK9]|uniref:Single-stranded DNA-binding protein n=1 Tax=Laribacter hongkongensis (strain HLHK9) TaxID=557598 RepID=C1D7P5_LARHH|nr:single-stranded DNA-binding protein [Laribacter hongkongensis]ACO74485.1 single-strand binding protein [Laribacter hongkongensis HLHK9]
MASVNKVILVGNLGRDPEVRYMPNGEAVCTFSIATTDSWKDKNGQKQERTEWHNIILYRRLAEIAGEYLKKGRPVYIEGRIQSRKYTGKDGVERTAFEILATELQMLGGRVESGGSTRTERSEPPPPPRRQEPKPASNFDDMDDDIPFAPLGLQYRFGLHCI